MGGFEARVRMERGEGKECGLGMKGDYED